MRVQAEQGETKQSTPKRRFSWGTVVAPVAIVALLGMAMATSPREAWQAPPQLVAAPGQQLHYLPFDAQQFMDTLIGQHGGATGNSADIESPIRLITSVVSARATNTVVVDHWEDGYDADPINSPGATTETFTMGAGQVQVFDNWVDVTRIGQIDPEGDGQPYYDGGDKIISTAPTVVSAGGWPAGALTLHAGASAVPEVSRYGYDFVSPVGEDTPFNSATASPWEYTGLIVAAAEDDTTVTVAGGAPFTLNEGQSHLVDGGIDLGDTVHADKPVAVYLSTGDKNVDWEGRLFELTPTERWTDTYFSPVTSRNNSNQVTRVFLYNPGASAITVDYTQSNGVTGTINVPAGGQNNYKFVQDLGASFTSAGNPFYALQAITTPETGGTQQNPNDTSSSYNWGFSLIPDAYLTPMVVVGYGVGSDNNSAETDNAVWIAPESATTVYVDRDGDAATGALTDSNGNKYDFSCPLTALSPRLLKDDGSSTCYTASAYTKDKLTGDGDMTGARIYTIDGTRLAAAWGQVPGLNATSPAIDMGTTILPFPSVDLVKTSDIVDDDGDGLADPGETIRYTITATNTGISPVDNLVLTDEVPEHTAYVPDSTIHNGGDLADDGSGTPFPLDGDGTILPPALSVGQTRTVTFEVVVDQPLDPTVTQIVNEATLSTSYGIYSAVDVQPTAPPEPGIALAKTVYLGHDGGASCQGGDDVTGLNGDLITYCFTATNDGATYLGTVTVDDPDLGIDDTDMDLVSGDPSLVAPGDSVTWSYDGTIDGDLPNTATATGAPVDASNVPLPDMDPVTAEDTAEVDEVAPSLTVSKTVYRGEDDGAFCEGGETAVGVAGDPATYCFVVTNTGDTSLSGVTLADGDLHIDQGDMTVTSGDLALLAPGDSIELYVESTYAGDLLNTVTATGTPSDPNGDPFPGIEDVEDEDTASIDQVAPAVSVEKTVYRGHDLGASCSGSESVAGLNGDAVTYCFVVTNEGDTDLEPVTLNDADLGVDQSQMTVLSGDLTSMAPGASAVLYVETTMSGDLTNTAVVTGTPTSGGVPVPTPEPVTDEDTASVDAVGPAISVAKTVYGGQDDGAGCEGDDSIFAHPGDEVTYCFAVTNNGDVDLSPVHVVDDDLPNIDETDMTVLSGDLASLAPGDTAVLYYETTVDGDLVNTATATGTPVDDGGDPLPVPDVEDEDSATVDEVHPDISVAKTVYRGHDDGAQCPGGELVHYTSGGDLTYCFAVTNEGDTDLSPVTVLDGDLGVNDTGMTVLSGDLASLAPGDTTVLYVETTLVDDLVNTTTVTGTPVDGNGTQMPGIDQVTADDTAEVDEVGPAVSIAKTVYAGQDDGAGCPGGELQNGAPGAELTYCFVVTNEGDTTLDPVIVTDDDLGHIDETDMNVVSGSLSSLAPGDSVVLSYDAILDGDLVNEATVTGTPVDGGGDPIDGLEPVSADDTAQVEELNPLIVVEKTVYRGDNGGAGCPGADSVPARSGDDVTYCFAVTNNGGATLSPVVLDDPALGNIDQNDMTLLSGSLASLAPGDTAVLYFHTSVDGDLHNTVTATGTPVDGPDPLPGGTPVDDDDSADVDEVTPSITVDKTVYQGHNAGADCAGGEIEHVLNGADVTYCFEVTNDGDTTLAPVTLDDDDLHVTDAGMTVLSGDLAQLDPGDTAVLYVDATVSADLVNVVTASGTLADANGDPLDGLAPVTATDTAEVDQVAPAISVAKTVYRGHDDGASCPGGELVEGASGANVTFCFVVTNTGDTTVAAVEVADDDLAPGLDQDDMDILNGGDLDSLEPGESVTLYYEASLTDDLVNTTTVSGTPVGDGGDPLPGVPEVTDEDTAEVDEVGPSVSVEKTVYHGHNAGASCAGSDSVTLRSGAPITYCVVVTNDGEATLAPVTLDDTTFGIDDSQMTVVGPGSLASLAPGASVTLYYQSTVDGDVTNVVEATGDPVDTGGDPLPGGTPVTDEDTADVNEVAPSVSIAKTVYRGLDDGAGCPGGESVSAVHGRGVTYCFAVTNDGDTELAPVTVADPNLGATQASGLVLLSGSLDSLDPGQTAVLYFETTVDGDLINHATATGTPADGSGDPLPNVPNVTDEDTARVDEIAPSMTLLTEVLDPFTSDWFDADDASATLGSNDGNPATLRAGDTASFRFTVTNTGDAAISDVVVDAPECDAVPALASGDTTNPGVLDEGETWVLTCEVSGVTSGLTMDGSVTGDSIDGAPEGSGEHEAADTQVAAISIEKTVEDAGTGDFLDLTTIEPGGDVTFRIVVTNSGEVPLSGVDVNDALGPDCARGFLDILEPGDSFAAYTCVVSGVEAGFVNTATAAGTPVDDVGAQLAGDVSADDAATVAVEAPPVTDLSITKDLTGVDEGSNTASWQVTVTNVGEVAATEPIVVTDDLPAELAYRSASGDGWSCEFDDPTVVCVTDTDLAPGASTTFTVETYVNGEPGDSITNVAQVSGSDDTNSDNNTDDAAVDVLSQGQLFPDIPSELPRTGADIAGLVAAAGLLIAGGLVFRRAGKRRQA